MKTKRIDLDIDIIGGQGSLTTAEETALSDFFQNKKLLLKRKTTVKKKKVEA